MGPAVKRQEDQPSDLALDREKNATQNSTSYGTPLERSEANVSAQAVQGDNLISDDNIEKGVVTKPAILLGAIASIGGFIFGYESGQISGMSQAKYIRRPVINILQDFFRCLTS